MRRRTVLATVTSGLAALSLAGCLGASEPATEPDPADTSTNTPGSTTTTDGTTDTLDGTTTAPGDSTTASGAAFSGVSCPSFVDNADRTICSTTADTDAAPLVFEPEQPVFEPTTGDGSVETLSVELRNQSEASFGFNPYGWALYRHVEDDWEHVAPDVHPEPWTTVGPGGGYTYELSVETHPSPHSESTRAIEEDLESGVYALAVHGFLGEDGDEKQRVECVAIFAVERTA